MSTAIDSSAISVEERQAMLQRYVTGQVNHGWRVISQTDTTAQLEKGKNTSHGLHIFLTILTLGLWLLVWIPLVIFGGRKSQYAQVTDAGQVIVT